MANVLSVYRDGALYCQADLTVTTLRIGRSSENDVILEDGLKRVSRTHAELRIEGERIVLTDLGSANGTLIGGAPIQSVVLGAGTEFEIGPYRLVWQVAGGPVSPSSDTGITAPTAGKSSAVYQREPLEAPAPAAQSDTTKAPMDLAEILKAVQKHPAALAVCVLALIAVGVGAFVLTRAHHGTAGAETEQASSVSRANGNNPQATTTIPGPAGTTTIPGPTTTTTISSSTTTSTTTTVPPTTTTTTIPATPAAGGKTKGNTKKKDAAQSAYPQLSARPGESKGHVNERSRQAHERFVEADRLATAGRLPDAAKSFEDLLAIEPGYPGAQEALTAVRERIADQSRQRFDEGKALEAKQDWNGALQRYQEARTMNPALPDVDKHIADVRMNRKKDCQTQTTNATLFFNHQHWDEARSAAGRALASCDESSQEYRTSKEVFDKLPK